MTAPAPARAAQPSPPASLRRAAPRHRPWLIAAACLLCAALSTLAHAQPGRRVALVIGNAAYEEAPLRNPVNDASDLAAALRRLGFDVTMLADRDRARTMQAVREFGQTARQAEVALFYFAGHGVQIRGTNYLLPTGQRFRDEADVETEAIDVNTVLARLEDAGPQVSVVILDACRTNPLQRSGRAVPRGLARMDSPSGALVAFAAQPGAEALDGDGRNGVYTKHLLATIETPGLTIEQMFRRVRAHVEQETNRRQSPREESSLVGEDFHFVKTPAATTPVAPPPAVPATGPPAAVAGTRGRYGPELGGLSLGMSQGQAAELLGADMELYFLYRGLSEYRLAKSKRILGEQEHVMLQFDEGLGLSTMTFTVSADSGDAAANVVERAIPLLAMDPTQGPVARKALTGFLGEHRFSAERTAGNAWRSISASRATNGASNGFDVTVMLASADPPPRRPADDEAPLRHRYDEADEAYAQSRRRASKAQGILSPYHGVYAAICREDTPIVGTQRHWKLLLPRQRMLLWSEGDTVYTHWGLRTDAQNLTSVEQRGVGEASVAAKGGQKEHIVVFRVDGVEPDGRPSTWRFGSDGRWWLGPRDATDDLAMLRRCETL